jgi:hypothetical protein
MPKTITGKPRKHAKTSFPAGAPIAPAEVPAVRIQNVTGLHVPEEKAEKICQAHAAGMPITEICRIYNTSHHTVAAIIRNRPELLSRALDIAGKNFATLSALLSAQLLDDMQHMKPHEKTVAASIAMEKGLLASGQATQRIEHVQAPSADEWSDMVDAVIVESVPAMGITGQTRATKEHNRTHSPTLEGASGEQPPASDCSVTVGEDGVPVFEPEEARFLPPPPPTDGGGAGVRSSSRPSYPDSTDDEKFFTKS